MDDRGWEMRPMSIDTQNNAEGKYPKIGIDHVCAGFGFAILSSAMGGLSCAISFIVGEWYYQKYEYHAKDHAVLYDMGNVGMWGGVVTDLVLYILILTFACNLDPKRNQRSNRDMSSSSLEMICYPASPVGLSCIEGCCCPILVLMAFHALNMFSSGSVGYWIYTRHHKLTLDFYESIEALAVGVAITLIPLCFTNICLLTAYSNFKLSGTTSTPFSYSGSRAPFVVFNKKTDEEALRDELTKQLNENKRLLRTGIF